MSKGKFLTAEEEKELSLRVQANNDQEALAILVEKNLRLVRSEVQKFATDNKLAENMKEDLVQEGNIGLMDAAKRYDHTKGRFSTYAVFWIKKRMLDYFSQNVHKVYVPSRLVNLHHKKKREAYYQSASEEYVTENTEELSIDENIQRRLSFIPDKYISIHQPLEVSASQKSVYLEEVITDAKENTEEKVVDDMHKEYVKNTVLAILSGKKRDVISRMYGLEIQREMSVTEIADSLGISKERVRKIHTEAIEYLRSHFNYIDHIEESSHLF